MNRSEYNELVAKLNEGNPVSEETYQEMVDFAKAKKIKRPPANGSVDAAAVKEAATSVKNSGKKGKAKAKPAKKAAAKREPKPKVACNPKLFGSDEKCEKDARSNGVCATHYSRLVYRAKPENAEKAREASRNYAARIRAEKAKKGKKSKPAA
jgi:hypothetical protein